MAMSRQDAINDALARMCDIGFTWGPNFAEHGPMAAEAISMLGHNEAVAGWVEAYKARRSHIPAPPRCGPIDDADEAGWQSALGNPSRTSDWHDYFGRELAEKPVRHTVREWVPRLIDGHAGALTHGLIRTGHAVRGLPVDGDPTPLQLDELARSFAYWAGTYRALPGSAEPEIVAVMPDATEVGTDAAISRHTAFLARVLLAHLDMPIMPVIQLVHTVTSAAAIRNVQPFLPSEFAEQAHECARRVSAAILARVVPMPLTSSSAEPSPSRLQWDDLAERAVAHGDEHVIKLTEACLHEDFIRPDPVYRALAEAIQRRLPAWS
jgi:hypothetical protein